MSDTNTLLPPPKKQQEEGLLLPPPPKKKDTVTPATTSTDGSVTKSVTPSSKSAIPSNLKDLAAPPVAVEDVNKPFKDYQVPSPTETFESATGEDENVSIRHPHPYYVNGQQVTREELRDKLFEPQFVEQLQQGTVKLELPEDDPDTKALVTRQQQSGTRLGDKFDYLMSGLNDVAAGVVGMPNYVANIAREIGVDVPMDVWEIESKYGSKLLKKSAQEYIEQTRQYEDGFVGALSKGDMVGAADQAFNTVVQSAPVSISVALTGAALGPPAALGTMAGIVASGEYATSDEYEGLTNAERLVRSSVFGVAEAAGEMVTGGILTKNFNVFKSGLRSIVYKTAVKQGKEVAQELATELAKKQAKEIFKEYGIDIAKEGGSELFTEMVQMGTDDIMGVQDYELKDYLNNGIEATMLGAVSGGIMGTPTAAKGVKRFVDEKLSQGKGEDLKQAVDKKVASGTIKPEAGEKIKENIDTRTAVVNSVPQDAPNREELVDLIAQKAELEKQVAESKAPPQATEAKIEALDREYNEKTGAPLTEKEQKELEKLEAKKEEKPAEGEKKKELTESEQATLDHFEKRKQKAKDLLKKKPTLEVAAEVTKPVVEEKMKVVPTEGQSFEYNNEAEIPKELKGIEPISRSEIQVGKGKKIRLTFSGQQLIDAGIAESMSPIEETKPITNEKTQTPQAEVLTETPLKKEAEIVQEEPAKAKTGTQEFQDTMDEIYSEISKEESAKETDKDKQARFKAELLKRGLPEQGAEGSSKLLVKALTDKNTALGVLDMANKNLRELWSKETGMDLPKSQKGTRQVIEEYFKNPEEAKNIPDAAKGALALYDGDVLKLANGDQNYIYENVPEATPEIAQQIIDAAREKVKQGGGEKMLKTEKPQPEKKSIADIKAEQALNQRFNYGKEGLMTRKEFMDKKLAEGATVEVTVEEGTKVKPEPKTTKQQVAQGEAKTPTKFKQEAKKIEELQELTQGEAYYYHPEKLVERLKKEGYKFTIDQVPDKEKSHLTENNQYKVKVTLPSGEQYQYFDVFGKSKSGLSQDLVLAAIEANKKYAPDYYEKEITKEGEAKETKIEVKQKPETLTKEETKLKKGLPEGTTVIKATDSDNQVEIKIKKKAVEANQAADDKGISLKEQKNDLVAKMQSAVAIMKGEESVTPELEKELNEYGIRVVKAADRKSEIQKDADVIDAQIAELEQQIEAEEKANAKKIKRGTSWDEEWTVRNKQRQLKAERQSLVDRRDKISERIYAANADQLEFQIKGDGTVRVGLTKLADTLEMTKEQFPDTEEPKKKEFGGKSMSIGKGGKRAPYDAMAGRTPAEALEIAKDNLDNAKGNKELAKIMKERLDYAQGEFDDAKERGEENTIWAEHKSVVEREEQRVQDLKDKEAQRINKNTYKKNGNLFYEDLDGNEYVATPTKGGYDITVNGKEMTIGAKKESDVKGVFTEIATNRIDSPTAYEKPDVTPNERIQRGKDKLKKLYLGKPGAAGKAYDITSLAAETLEALYDVARGYAEKGIKEGFDGLKEFIKFIKEETESDLTEKDITEIYEKANPKEETKEEGKEPEGKEKEKTILTKRAYKGKLRDEVKKYLEEKGLTRKVISQEERSRQAKEFIAEYGEEIAIASVENFDIRGGQASSILAQVIKRQNQDMAKLDATDTEKLDALAKEQAEVTALLEREGFFGGEFAGQLAFEYQDDALGFNVEKLIQNYKDVNNGEIPAEAEAKIRALKKENEELNVKIAEAEQRAKEAEEKATMQNIKDAVEREKKTRKEPKIFGRTRVAKGAQDLIKALGTPTPGLALASKLPSVAKALTEIGQGLIEEGKATFDNVVEKIEDYLNENFKGKVDFEKVRDEITQKFQDIQAEAAKIKIPHSVIRDFVERGIDNINDLTTAIQELYPDASEREIRDAITGYGKISNPNMEEIEVQIRKMKRAGRVISALEDVANKKRPLRSGKQRDKLDAQERALNKELREAMKDLPMDEETEASQLKTALDGIKQRLRNQIDDLNREIEAGEKTPISDRTIEYDAEAKALAEERDRVKEVHDEVFGKPELTDEQRINIATKALEKSIANLEERIKTGDVLPKKAESKTPETPELKALRERREKLQEEIQNLRDASKIKKTPQEIATENAIKSNQKAIEEKERRIRENDLSPTPKKEVADKNNAELKALRAKNEALDNQLQKLRNAAKVKRDASVVATENAIKSIERRTKDIQDRIKKNELERAKKPSLVKNTPEYQKAKKKLEAENEKLKKLQEAAGIPSKKRLENLKKATERRIKELERRIREKDFAKKEKKPLIADTELNRLRAEKIRIQEEYNKEFYKAKLQNRTTSEKIKDHLWDAWNLTRALRATGEFSFVLLQGLINTVAHPLQATEAMKNSLKFMASPKKTEAWLNNLRTQDYYPILKDSKLSITEPNAEITAREELFYSGWTDMIWNNIGKIFGKKAETWQKLNPLHALERASVGYLDTQRVLRFLDGVEMLKEKGIEFQDNKQAYKDMADVINTFTGRASIGRLDPNILSKVFFSPRNWASSIKTATPYAFYHFGKMRAGAESWKPSVAQKMAISDFTKFVGLTTSMVALAAISLNDDDDEETKVELDPRSSDFGKIKMGDTRIDPWGGRIQQIVFISRMISDSIKNAKGETVPLGTPYKAPTRAELMLQMATNKLAPSASILEKYLTSKEQKDGTRVDKFGNPYEFSQELKENLYPIYWETVSELMKDDPNAMNGLLAFYAFFGGGVNVYEPKPEKEKKVAAPLTPADRAKLRQEAIEKSKQLREEYKKKNQ